MNIKVEISARHIHLSEEDYRSLFGDSKPIGIKELSQKDIACEETVEVVGPKNKLPNVRLLIPFRPKSQLEISRSEAIFLGIDPPLKLSGDLPGAQIKIIGPKGKLEAPIAIVAKRHLHLPPAEAEKLNLKNLDIVSVEIASNRGLIFKNIVVRVAPHYSPAVHIDTDEANAAGMNKCENEKLILN